MKYNLVLVFVFFVTAACAQRDEKELTQKTHLLSATVFGTRDSLTLKKLLANTVSYGHSHGKLQTRSELIKAISSSQSRYTDTLVSNLKIFIEDKTAIVRYLFNAKEIKKDGSVTDLNLSIMLVWIKDKKEWRLMGRQAVGVQ